MHRALLDTEGKIAYHYLIEDQPRKTRDCKLILPACWKLSEGDNRRAGLYQTKVRLLPKANLGLE